MLSVFLPSPPTRRRRALERPPDSPRKPDGAAQKQPAEEQSDLHYASVQFSKKPADPVYGNITPRAAQRRPAEGGEDGVEYAALTFRRAGKLPGHTPRASGEEPAPLYGVAHKH
ncbi:hypothetical protein EYF80_065614 [Liparis tanakae]|uniref:Uncharacterized protein n=1 Tax=Liparis tanakae TaxID=230148 RepID=A0A4Z2E7H2_9TELE|nr:hypothetical protein EYF80_065614 [Liparis tanakae]